MSLISDCILRRYITKTRGEKKEEGVETTSVGIPGILFNLSV